MSYKNDRKFTDDAHTIALIHYNNIEWVENNPDNIQELDINQGIDYVFDSNGRKKHVQERFRNDKYSDFNEITIRYARPNNSHPERRQSEYFKILADYITYGYINKNKEFIKFGIFDLNLIKTRINNGDIIINTEIGVNGKPIQNKCAKDDINLYAGFQLNKDDSSNFICINPKKYLELWPEDRDAFVVYSFGNFI
jgi:hypothetical protein